MIDLKGQIRLQNIFNSYTIDTLPKSIMLLGQDGCGKKSLAANLAERLNIPLVLITNNVSEEDLMAYSMDPIVKIYLIDLTTFKEKNQNILLKFIEEPSYYAYNILVTTSEIGILPTLMNRCIKYHFDEYSKEELQQVSWMNAAWDNELLYKVCKTPGQIMDFDGFQIQQLYDLCSNIVNNISRANYANTLGIYTKINYKEDYNKFDFNVFLNMLEVCAFDNYIDSYDANALLIYDKTNLFKSMYAKANSPVKEQFMINFLTSLWKEVHKEC